MTVFLVIFVVFTLIYFTEGLCIWTVQRDACNNSTEGCIWSSPELEMEGGCSPNNDVLPCNELYAIHECGMAAKGCCWEEFSDGSFGCTDCSNIIIIRTPAPTSTFVGDYCYCEIPDEYNEGGGTPTTAPTSTPTRSPTAPGAKKPKSSGCTAILGYGDCCCDKNYGQQTLTFINLDPLQRTIESMVWYFDKPSTDPFDIVCSFNCIDYGESAICNISGWDYESGDNTRRRPPYDSFKTDTYFDIDYVDGEICQSFFHTSCSSDIVGYFDAKDVNVCNIKCTAWTDANPNRIANCNNNLEQCTCDGNTTSIQSTTTSEPTPSVPLPTSICTPTKNPSSAPTKVPSVNPSSITSSPTKVPSVSPTNPTSPPISTTSSSSGSVTTTSSGSATTQSAGSVTTGSSGSAATTSSGSAATTSSIVSASGSVTTTSSGSAATTAATAANNTNRPFSHFSLFCFVFLFFCV